ncbi:MAG: tetratricopeptide repeat protein [Candidatus Saliniplasma sp.]
MVKGFTAKDKVIVHLLEYYDKQDKYPQPAEITQEGIAKSIGSKQNTVSYAVRNLVKEDILDERTTRVEGKKQRRKGYFLSDKGVEKARKKKQEMERTRVTLSLDGEDREVMIMDVNKYLHTNFSTIEILNRIEDGKLEYSIEEKEKDLVSYLVDMPEPPIYSLDNMGPLERWWEENENNISLLESKDGIDRTIILTSFIEKLEGQVNLFYFKLDEWHTPRYLLNQFAGFLSKAGEHRLASYLEASEGMDYIEIFTNFRKDLDSLSSSLMVIEDVPEDEELIRLIGRISKNIEEQPDIKLVLTTDINNLENDIDISPKKIRLSKGTASNFYQRSSQYYGITDENEDVIGTILNNRLTSEEYLALSYISIFRKPVEKSEITTLEHVNEMTLKNLLQTPLLNQTLEGKPILPVILKERLRGMMINTYRRTLHEKASDYYCGTAARDPSESIECAFHSVKAGDYKRLVDELMDHGREILKAGLSKSLLYILDIIDIDGMLDEDRAIVDYFAGECHRIEKDYGKAMSRFTSMIERTDDPVMLARAHEGIGDIKVERSDYESAIEEYMQSEDLLEDSLVENEPLLGRIYFKVAHLSNEQGDYIEAKEYLKKSISILEHRSRYSLLTSSYFLLARIEKGRGKWEEALDNFKKGVDSWKKINESYQRVGKLHDIGSFYKVIRELSNAEKFLKETIESCEKFGYRHLKAQALLTLSECHLEKGDYDEAIKTAGEANDIFGFLGKEEEQGYVHALFGQIYIKLKMEDKAEDHLSRAISIYQKLGSSYSLGLAYFSMAKLQERKGNQQGIADNYRKALLSITSSGADEMAQKIKKEMRTVPLSM